MKVISTHLEVIERCAEYLEDNYGKKGPVFGGQKIQSLPKEERLQKAAALAPILRGFCSSANKNDWSFYR